MAQLSALTEAEQLKYDRKLRVSSYEVIFLVCQVALIALFGVGTDFSGSTDVVDNVGTANRVDNLFSFYTHIALMAFVGWGFLMAYMKKHGFSSIGYPLLLAP